MHIIYECVANEMEEEGPLIFLNFGYHGNHALDNNHNNVFNKCAIKCKVTFELQKLLLNYITKLNIYIFIRKHTFRYDHLCILLNCK